jgi:hypothetical protein
MILCSCALNLATSSRVVIPPLPLERGICATCTDCSLTLLLARQHHHWQRLRKEIAVPVTLELTTNQDVWQQATNRPLFEPQCLLRPICRSRYVWKFDATPLYTQYRYGPKAFLPHVSLGPCRPLVWPHGSRPLLSCVPMAGLSLKSGALLRRLVAAHAGTTRDYEYQVSCDCADRPFGSINLARAWAEAMLHLPRKTVLERPSSFVAQKLINE